MCSAHTMTPALSTSSTLSVGSSAGLEGRRLDLREVMLAAVRGWVAWRTERAVGEPDSRMAFLMGRRLGLRMWWPIYAVLVVTMTAAETATFCLV